ncbi:unnamed protein product, partial [Dicrocoelium dendriticum]
FDICCPLETIYVHSEGFHPLQVKRLRRLKEKAFKERDGTPVRSLTGRIKEELHRL